MPKRTAEVLAAYLLFLILTPIMSLAPSEYPAIVSDVSGEDPEIRFSVQKGGNRWIKFNISFYNNYDKYYLEDTEWDFFNAELYHMNGTYLGNARPRDIDRYLLFISPHGRTDIWWYWGAKIHTTDGASSPSPGTYKVSGVYRRNDSIVKTNPIEFSLGRQKTSRPRSGVAAIRIGFQYSSYGVLLTGFIFDGLLYLNRNKIGLEPRWGNIRILLWFLSIILWILFTALSSQAELIYDLKTYFIQIW